MDPSSASNDSVQNMEMMMETHQQITDKQMQVQLAMAAKDSEKDVSNMLARTISDANYTQIIR